MTMPARPVLAVLDTNVVIAGLLWGELPATYWRVQSMGGALCLPPVQFLCKSLL
jgi:hypothetical protein